MRRRRSDRTARSRDPRLSTTRPRVYVAQPLFADVLAPLAAHAELIVEPVEGKRDAADLADGLRSADAAIVTIVERVDAAAIAAAQRLKIVANVGVGYDNLDLAALRAAGIVATNTPDVLTDTVADFAFALLLGVGRRVTEAERWLRDGQWQRWSFDRLLGRDAHGATLGILGMGRIGQAIAQRARGFRMDVLYHSRHALAPEREQACAARWVDREALLRRADFLIVAVPHAPETHHLIDAAALARMKPGAFLINIARGGVVDDAALADALAAGRLAGAALDVFEGEPAIHPGLLAARNVVLTPHIASASLDTRRAMVRVAVTNVLAALGRGPDAGRPPNVIGG